MTDNMNGLVLQNIATLAHSPAYASNCDNAIRTASGVKPVLLD